MSSEPTIKVIETRYRGYLMRSRLEARWATWLDVARVPFEYEAEGYDLEVHPDFEYRGQFWTSAPARVWYLPDFLIPSWNAFLEIKPRTEITTEMAGKAWALSCASGKPVVMILGQPWPGEYEAHLFDGDGIMIGPGRFRQCLPTRSIWLKSSVPEYDWGFCLTRGFPWNQELQRAVYDFSAKYGDPLQPAFDAARSARFERH